MSCRALVTGCAVAGWPRPAAAAWDWMGWVPSAHAPTTTLTVADWRCGRYVACCNQSSMPGHLLPMDFFTSCTARSVTNSVLRATMPHIFSWWRNLQVMPPAGDARVSLSGCMGRMA